MATGDRAMAAGRTQVAKQAFDSALRIDPTSRKAQDGLQHMRNTDAARTVLADGGAKDEPADAVRVVPDTTQQRRLIRNHRKPARQPRANRPRLAKMVIRGSRYRQCGARRRAIRGSARGV